MVEINLNFRFKDGLRVNTTPESRYRLEGGTNTLKIESPLESDCGNYSCVSSDVYAVIPVRSKY